MFIRCSEGSVCSLDLGNVDVDSVVDVTGVRSDCCCKGSEDRDVEDDFHNES